MSRWLARKNPFHPRVIVVGSGRVTRCRVEWLLREGVEVSAYVDIDPRKVRRVHNGVPVIAVDDLPAAGEAFVVSCVGKRGAREWIAGWLGERGYRHGENWISAA